MALLMSVRMFLPWLLPRKFPNRWGCCSSAGATHAFIPRATILKPLFPKTTPPGTILREIMFQDLRTRSRWNNPSGYRLPRCANSSLSAPRRSVAALIADVATDFGRSPAGEPLAHAYKVDKGVRHEAENWELTSDLRMLGGGEGDHQDCFIAHSDRRSLQAGGGSYASTGGSENPEERRMGRDRKAHIRSAGYRALPR